MSAYAEAPFIHGPPLTPKFQPITDIHRYELTYQPIHDYSIPFKVVDGHQPGSWSNFTRIGTNYGTMGPEARHIQPVKKKLNQPGYHWDGEGVQVTLYHHLWAGMWHSLGGIADAKNEKRKGGHLNLDAPYSPVIRDEYQPKIVGAYIHVQGTGRLKLELKAREDKPPFREYADPIRILYVDIDPPHPQTIVWLWQEKLNDEVPIWLHAPLEIRDSPKVLAKIHDVITDPPAAMLSWVTDKRGTNLKITEIGLILLYPKIDSAPRRFLLKSLAKLAFCYESNPDNSQLALVRDRANWPPAKADNIPASGMFCLAMAAAQAEGLVRHQDAVNALRAIHFTVSNFVQPYAKKNRETGLLPHFVTWEKDHYVPSPPNPTDKSGDAQASEYSTIDTALYYHSMLLAAQILKEENILYKLKTAVRDIRWKSLLTPDGYITMGIDSQTGNNLDQCKTWHPWGGETALVLCLMEMANDRVKPRMDPPAEFENQKIGVFCGRGFIAEIQSLFYPDFDQHVPDALTGQDWAQIRSNLRNAQVKRVHQVFKDSEAARLDLFGLSSGEWLYEDKKYLANGLWNLLDECPDNKKNADPQNPEKVLFPHYILMAARSGNQNEAVELLEALEQRGLFPPWGLVETFNDNLDRSLGMLSALNASFEVISTYHLLVATSQSTVPYDVIYDACRQLDLTRQAIGLFYHQRQE